MKARSPKRYVMETLFRALADRTRLRLVNLMGDEEVCVCFLVEALKLSQPKISRHLAYLRRAGIVGARRQGKWMHYRVSVPSDVEAGILAAVRSALNQDKQMQVDRNRLVGLCCSSAVPAPLKNAPKPARVLSAQPLER